MTASKLRSWDIETDKALDIESEKDLCLLVPRNTYVNLADLGLRSNHPRFGPCNMGAEWLYGTPRCLEDSNSILNRPYATVEEVAHLIQRRVNRMLPKII